MLSDPPLVVITTPGGVGLLRQLAALLGAIVEGLVVTMGTGNLLSLLSGESAVVLTREPLALVAGLSLQVLCLPGVLSFEALALDALTALVGVLTLIVLALIVLTLIVLAPIGEAALLLVGEAVSASVLAVLGLLRVVVAASRTGGSGHGTAHARSGRGAGVLAPVALAEGAPVPVQPVTVQGAPIATQLAGPPVITKATAILGEVPLIHPALIGTEIASLLVTQALVPATKIIATKIPSIMITAAKITTARTLLPVDPVVLEQPVLVGRVEVMPGVEVGGVLDGALVEGDHELVAGELGAGERHEALVRPEEAGVHGDPARLAGLVVEEQLFDLADAVAVLVIDGGGEGLVCGAVLHHESFRRRDRAAVRTRCLHSSDPDLTVDRVQAVGFL